MALEVVVVIQVVLLSPLKPPVVFGPAPWCIGGMKSMGVISPLGRLGYLVVGVVHYL